MAGHPDYRGTQTKLAAGVPDVHTTARSSSLRYVDLDRRINDDYGCFGERFQTSIDPSFGSTGASDAYPG